MLERKLLSGLCRSDYTNPGNSVLFVHGFTGDPESTWTDPKSFGDQQLDRHSSTSQGYMFGGVQMSKMKLPNRKHQPKPKVYWPRDLLPDALPRTRVLTYGYDTHVRHVFNGPVSQNTLYNHAGDLLASLEPERRTAPDRPLLLVAHSLGGLLVKEALRLSRGYDAQAPLRSIYDSVVGVIFFGTPHSGADPRSLAHHVVASIALAIGFRANNRIIELLLPSSGYLIQLRDEFKRMIDKNEWLIHSFQEQYPLTGLLGKKVRSFFAVSHLMLLQGV